jgi:hypothetical protein
MPSRTALLTDLFETPPIAPRPVALPKPRLSRLAGLESVAPLADRPTATLDVMRGARRLLWSMNFTVATEVTLPNGLRADVVGFAPSGTIWIVEAKSCWADFAQDRKWQNYQPWCHVFALAVDLNFPIERLEPGLDVILCDRYGGHVEGAPECRTMTPRAVRDMQRALIRRLGEAERERDLASRIEV